MITENKIERISEVVISVLYSRFKTFPHNTEGNRNAPFHEAFLNAFKNEIEKHIPDIPYFITMSSWLHGLSTTLGQSFFEKTAHILCDGEKREYTTGKMGILKITESQETAIFEIITDLYNNVHIPNKEREEKILYDSTDDTLVDSTGFSADVYYETDEEVVAIELKSVKPNSGEMKGEKKKVLEGKAALKRMNPNKEVKFYIGFPFDPTGKGVSYDKSRFVSTVINLDKSFALDEILIAGELWDMLSGEQNTMQTLLDIINGIATTDFENKFDFINNVQNRNDKRYKQILNEWNLYGEISIVDNINNLKEKSLEKKTLQKLLNKSLFDSDGKYNENRAYDILHI